MKNLTTSFTFLMCSVVISSLFAQGTINWNNTSTTLISLNGSPMPARVSPATTYYYGLFVAPAGTPAPTSIYDPNWQNIIAYATNHTSIVGRILSGGTATVIGYAAGSNANYIVRGWRTFSGNYADWPTAISGWGFDLAYFGQSTAGPATLGGLSAGGTLYPTPPAFGTSPPRISGFNLNFVGCPECVPPIFYIQPSNTVAGLGGNATIWVSTGIWPPTTYEWRKDGLTVVTSTNSTLTITNITLGNGGNYDVVAYNPYGVSTSSVATLTVLTPAILESPAYTLNNQFQFTVTGPTGSNYVVQVATNLSASTIWSPLITNATPFTFVDSNAIASPQKFYRVQAR